MTNRTTPDLRPIEECVEFYKNAVTKEELVKLWKRQRGAPKLVMLKPPC